MAEVPGNNGQRRRHQGSCLAQVVTGKVDGPKLDGSYKIGQVIISPKVGAIDRQEVWEWRQPLKKQKETEYCLPNPESYSQVDQMLGMLVMSSHWDHFFSTLFYWRSNLYPLVVSIFFPSGLFSSVFSGSFLPSWPWFDRLLFWEDRWCFSLL